LCLRVYTCEACGQAWLETFHLVRRRFEKQRK
jgi:hypothetical protein